MGQLVSAARSHGLHCIAEMRIRSANVFAKRKPTGNSVRFPSSTILLMQLMTITLIWFWRPLCRCFWYISACPQRLMMFVVSIRVYARGRLSMSLWHIIGRSHYMRQRTCCSIPCKSVHTVIHPTLSRYFHTKDRIFCYQKMPCNFYSNTMIFLKVPSGSQLPNVAWWCTSSWSWLIWVEPNVPHIMQEQSRWDSWSHLCLGRCPIEVDCCWCKEDEIERVCPEVQGCKFYLKGTKPYSPWSHPT
jgi:hypothetical protein